MQKAGEETDLAQSEFKNASQEDCQLDGHGQQPSVVFVMFVEEEQHGLVEHVDVAVGVLLGAFSFVVDDRGGVVIVLEALLQQPAREVYVLAVHEERFVESPGLLQSLFRGKHKCS